MGLDAPSLKFLYAAKQRGVDFSDSMMIGRQSLRLNATIMGEVFRTLSVDRDVDSFLRETAGYGEPFLRMLGARQINSMDASSYENATHVHDMNVPIDDSLRGRFSVVLDGGTLEHIFNFPQAVQNCMAMVRLGGHFIQVSIANNFMGHGFYQFSPELIYRIFSEENGFALDAVLLHEVVPEGKWYRVSDPKDVNRRVELSNRNPTYICTLAKRTSLKPIFATAPQQSDYSAIWQHGPVSREPVPNGMNSKSLGATLKRLIPGRLKRAVKAAIAANAAPEFNPECYREIRESDLVKGMIE